MTGKAHRIIKEMLRILLSVCFGLAATGFLLFTMLFLDRVIFKGDSTLPLEKRVPVAWVLTWPDYIWSNVWGSYDVIGSTLLTHVCIFSVAAYVFMRKRARHRPLR